MCQGVSKFSMIRSYKPKLMDYLDFYQLFINKVRNFTNSHEQMIFFLIDEK